MEEFRGVDHSLKAKEKKPKERGLFSKMIVKQVFLLNVIFTICAIGAFVYTGGSELSTLTMSWFGFTTVEMVALAGIEISKNVSRNEEDDDYIGG